MANDLNAPLTRGEARLLLEQVLFYFDQLAAANVRPDPIGHNLATVRRRIDELLTGHVETSRQAPVRAD